MVGGPITLTFERVENLPIKTDKKRSRNKW